MGPYMNLIRTIRHELKSNTTRCCIITLMVISIAVILGSQTAWTIGILCGVVTLGVGVKEFTESPEYKEWRLKQEKKLEEPLE